MKKVKQIYGTDIPKLNILANIENVVRAYEIAQVGNHSMTLAYYKSTDGDFDRDVNPKDCGIIAQTLGFTPVLNGDLIIEIIRRPDFDSLISHRGYESREAITDRINEAIERPAVTQFEKYDVCMQLLKTAYNRLNFGIYDVQTVFAVSSTIARMDGSGFIRVEHIAEAIQYRAIQYDETTKFYTPE